MSWLIWVAAAWGRDTWWVADDATADELAVALTATWPERDIEIVVGPRPEGAPGTTWDRALLVSYSDDGVRHADVADPTVAALLARSWALPSAPTPPERYLPEEPVKVVSVAVVEPVEERERHRYRLSTGMGTRVVNGQPRAAEGIRIVNELQRKALFFQNELFLGMSLRWASHAFTERPEEGVAFIVPMDRATIGLAVGLREQVGPVSFRVLAGPEVRWVEEWLFFRGIAWEMAPHQALGGRIGAGLDWDIGRFVVAPAVFARAATSDPVWSGGASLDLRFQWKR